MKFGWMTLSLSPSAADDLACVHQQLEQGVLAEAMGFDYLWLTEHNFTGECAYADPIPFAGALAARTSRARLGFAVIQMALHHPVRLAIQLAVLDNLSRGRLEVGIGRGSTYNEYEYVGFGLRSDDSHGRMDEAIHVLTRAWTEEPFVHDGKFFSVRLPAIRPRPVQRPHPPIWRSVIAAESLVECGRAGLPVMMSRVANARIPERLARYREGLEAGGHDAATARHSFGVSGKPAPLSSGHRLRGPPTERPLPPQPSSFERTIGRSPRSTLRMVGAISLGSTPLVTKPLAPRARSSSMSRGSSRPDRTTTRTRGVLRASPCSRDHEPSPPILRSSRTTSGARASRAGSTSATVDTVPTTSMSASSRRMRACR